MIYNDSMSFEIIFLGGATVWPNIGVSVFPNKGDGIYWHNLFRNGDINWNTKHKACPVLLGNKWICNKWIGFNSQWSQHNYNCGTRKDQLIRPEF